jgi:hypothetical protein
VQVEYSEFEIFVISVAVGVALQGTDLSIDGLLFPCRHEAGQFQKVFEAKR